MSIDKKHVYFLVLGIGIGMLSTSLLNIINPRVEQVNYTDDQIIKKAYELGMVSIKDVINENNKENSEKSENQIEISSEMENQNEVLNTSDNIENKDPEIISFIIDKGNTSEEIVNGLYEQGIIEDKDGLSKLITEKNVHHKFKYGKFDIVKGMDYESLIGILTN